VRRLVAKAEGERRDLVSLMALLRCCAFWERLLVPAFVFFFQKLYPFPWVNDPRRRHAAAAGGCMLLRAEALQRAGGITAVRRRLIDDCAVAALIKSHGSVWVGLSEDTRSLRPYARLADFWTMVARTAFTQLDHSFVWLLATVAAMTVSYGVPPLAVPYGLVASDLWAAVLGALAWAMMLATFRPTLSLYGLPAPVGAALPLAGVLFALMTIDSARRTWQRGGATWKGRTFDPMRAGAGPEAG
jgi:hopene-associated glycosyltransferase HpnB